MNITKLPLAQTHNSVSELMMYNLCKETVTLCLDCSHHVSFTFSWQQRQSGVRGHCLHRFCLPLLNIDILFWMCRVAKEQPNFFAVCSTLFCVRIPDTFFQILFIVLLSSCSASLYGCLPKNKEGTFFNAPGQRLSHVCVMAHFLLLIYKVVLCP